jgi:hypothetical protein
MTGLKSQRPRLLEAGAFLLQALVFQKALIPTGEFVHPFEPFVIIDDPYTHLPGPLAEGVAVSIGIAGSQKFPGQLNGCALRFVLADVNGIFWLDEGIPLVIAVLLEDILTPSG